MAGISTGRHLVLTGFGESHGPAVGGILDGLPAGLAIDEQHVNNKMARRSPGSSTLSSARRETDRVQWLSGIFEGKTTGAPIGFIIENQDVRSKDYDEMKDRFRPGHADYSYFAKYGIRDHRGGGRASARETAVRVAAGALAEQFLTAVSDISIHAYTSSIGEITMEQNWYEVNLNAIDDNDVRCPHAETAARMEKLIRKVRKEADSVGGVVTCVVNGMIPGLGNPLFAKLHADLGQAMLSIPAAHGFEYGEGFKGAAMLGSMHNDPFVNDKGKVRTCSNHCGGILGGISTGEALYFNTAFKPVATIAKEQDTVDIHGRPVRIKGKGRHDPCVVLRAVAVVEAMTALVLADHFLLNKTAKLQDD